MTWYGRCCARHPAAFHAGINDILLIGFALAAAEFVGETTAPIGIDVEGHGRQEELGRDVDLSRTVGWFTAKYPVSVKPGGLSWSQVANGDAALGAVIKDVKEQLRALPDGLTYGLLRYLNPDVDLAAADPSIGFNYLGRLGGGSELSDDLWQISREGSSIGSASTAVEMPLMHTVELNAGTVDTDEGSRLHANWDVGAIGPRSRGGHPAQPVVVRGVAWHLRTREVRRGRPDPFPTSHPPVSASTRSMNCCADTELPTSSR